MTTTVTDRPAVEPAEERISVRKAVALILTASVQDGLPFPYGITQNGIDNSIFSVRFNSLADLGAWVKFFGSETPAPRRHPSIDPPIMFANVHADWHGWAMQLTADDPIADPEPVDDETLAAVELAASVLA